MESFSADVAIIGAGPAGAATSIFLAKSEIKHVIFDKAVFPRDKICGDALSGKSISVLKKIDPGIITDMESSTDFLPSWGVKFIAPNGKALEVTFRKDRVDASHPPGFLAPRLIFDKYLLDRLNPAYVDIHQGAEIRKIERQDSGFLLHFNNDGQESVCRARMVVGSGGDRCVVRRELTDYRMDRRYYCAGLRSYYENVSGFHEQNFIELHFLPEVLPGYLWIFPLPGNRANVGIGMLSEKMQNRQISLKKIMENAITENPNIRERFRNARLVDEVKGWGLPLGSVQRKISGAGYLLTGDSASLIDPFTGEGIGNAMYSGMVAAQWIKEALEMDDTSETFLQGYDRDIYAGLWDELRLSATLQRLVNYPWLFNFVVNKARSNKTVSETLSCMFDDLNLRAKLRSPSFYFKLIFNR